MDITFINKKGRKKLAEGRTSGPAFTFCRKYKNKFVAVSAISTCKDYLNDLVHAEKYKLENFGKFGFYHSYKKLFDNKRPILAVSCIGNKYGVDRYPFNVSTSKLLEFIHSYEEKLGISYKTKLIGQCEYNPLYLTSDVNKEKAIILKFDKKWVSNSILISCYTYLLKVFLYKNTVYHECSEFDEKFQLLIDDEYYSYDKDESPSEVHDAGFLSI